MRMHIDMDDELVARVDAVAGRRKRSHFVREAVMTALEQRRRAELIRATRGSLPEGDHEWDSDPASWVREQRRADTRRVG